jgi:8-oxo-dGTP pyrophosphatase MutT (NUDIX family)
MQPHADAIDMVPLPSATVVLLRDGAAGLEVCLLKRHGQSDVLGGAYVFPGGKVDRWDAEHAAQLDVDAPTLAARLGEAQLGTAQVAALYVAAIRELFEETGVLLGAIDPAQAEAAWKRLREGLSFAELVDEQRLRLHASRVLPWSRWITPLTGGVVRKRFDTRFFVAALPEGQQAHHDGHEAIECLWLAPRAALQSYWDGAMALAPPQIMSLAHLARHGSVDSVFAEARSRTPPLVQPESFEEDGTRVLCYPGDARHSVGERALPGPTRLYWRAPRFEPAGGLAALTG